ncbi:MAG: NAD-dependent epimerase/dehydratase family protein [Thermoplasmataceae archaeon]
MAKFLISGGAGFLGRKLSERTLELGHSVTVVDDFSTALYEDFSKDIVLIKSRIEDFGTSEKFDFVVHLAARPSPEDYISNPVETILSNSIGTLRMIQISLNSGARFMYTSSSETYGDATIIPTPETYWGNVNFTGIRGCYDESKRFSEALIMAYHRQFRLDSRIQRPFNVYGPGIRPDGQYGRVVPRFILQALNDEDITVHGDGNQTRSFLYLDDWIDATWRYLTKESLNGEILNIGSSEEITINALSEIIIELTGSNSKIVHIDAREDDPHRRSADISEAKRLLNWEPATNLRSGLEKTIEWVRKKYL